MSTLRSPSDPDTRILSAAAAGVELRRWQRHPEAAVRLAGVVGERFETLIRLFETAAHEQSDSRIVPLDRVVTALFGARDLEAADSTANWRKFIQLLRTHLEDMECPLDIEFHKGKGSLRDRGVWISATLSPSQLLTETLSASPHLLPPPNDRYREAHFIPPTLAVPAAGRTFPHAIARFLQRCRGVERLEAWPELLRARLRSLGASLRPVFFVAQSPQMPLVGFWLEPTDRGGTWPEAILPSGDHLPNDTRRWFAAAWMAAAAETVLNLNRIARDKGQPGPRGILHFPAGWTPDFADTSLLLKEWPELVARVTLAFSESETATLVPLLKDLRRGWGSLSLIAPEAALEKWSSDERSAAQPDTMQLIDADGCATLSDRVPEILRRQAAVAPVPLVLVPRAENPDKARWSVWLTEQFATSGWKGGSLAVGESADLAWEELITLGAQGRGGRLALRREGPEEEVADLLEHMSRTGWTWRPIVMAHDDPGLLFDVACNAARLTLMVNLHGEIQRLTDAQMEDTSGRPLVVLGHQLTLVKPHNLLLVNRELPVNTHTDAGDPDPRRVRQADDEPGKARFEVLRAVLPSTHCPDLDSLNRFLDGLQRAHAMSNPLEISSGVGRQAEYPLAEWQDLVFQDDGTAVSRLLAWAQGQGPRSAVILGEYGSGKTFLCRVFCSALTKERQRSAEAGPVPVYVDLRDVPLPSRDIEYSSTAQAVLRHALARLKTREQTDAACHALREAVEAGLILLVLDGFDEIAARLSSHNSERLLRELLGLGGQRGRLLLSSRTHLFESRGEEDRQFGGQDSSANRDGRGEILRLYVQPFTEVQIASALEKRLGPKAANEAMAFIDQIHNLPELAQRPVLLDMIARSLDRLRATATGGRVLGATDLYDAFIQEWLERDKTKSICGYAEKRLQMGKMAITLWREGAEQGIDVERLPAWLREQFTDLRRDESDLLATNLRTANFLVRDAEGHFRFAHRSFWEYFLAAGLVEELRRHSRMALEGPRLGPEVIAFLVSLALRLDTAHRRSITETVVRILAAGNTPEAAVNAVLVLAFWQRTAADTAPSPAPKARLSSLSLDRTDLRGLRLEASDLEGADLSDAVLDGAQLPDAILNRSRLFRTSLVDTVLKGACFDSAEFDLADATRCDFRNSRGEGMRFAGPRLVQCQWEGAAWNPDRPGSALLFGTPPLPPWSVGTRQGLLPAHPPLFLTAAGQGAVAFSPDGRRLLSGSDDNTLRLWDAESGQNLRTLQGHEACVQSVAFSPDGRRLLSGSDDKTLRLWDAESGRCLRVTSSRGVSIGPDGWPLDNGTPREVLEQVFFPSEDGHSYTARELLEIRALGQPMTVTPLCDYTAAGTVRPTALP